MSQSPICYKPYKVSEQIWNRTVNREIWNRTVIRQIWNKTVSGENWNGIVRTRYVMTEKDSKPNQAWHTLPWKCISQQWFSYIKSCSWSKFCIPPSLFTVFKITASTHNQPTVAGFISMCFTHKHAHTYWCTYYPELRKSDWTIGLFMTTTKTIHFQHLLYKC